MGRKTEVPDAWDDDWETTADNQETPNSKAALDEEARLSKAERRARHEEANKQLWQSAETPPERPIFLEVGDNVPLRSEFKPAVKVLSRKPAPKIASREDPSSGLAGLKLDEDSEEEDRKRAEQEFAERQARAQREREEKQRRYNEVREKLFGSAAPAADNGQSRTSHSPNRRSRGKGRGRADQDARGHGPDQSPARGPNTKRQLYDPGYSAKPGSVFIQKRDGETDSSRATPIPREEQPIRAPRGPDGSGRGGFGFASRGSSRAGNAS